jgi:coenzyme Q-binding protein COQ10
MLSAQGELMLPFARETLFDLAADVEQYPQYLTGWISARIYERQPDIWYAEQVLGFGPVRLRFRSRAEMRRPERIEVSSDDSQFRRFRLLWGFAAGRDRSCRVALSIELDLRSMFLQRGLERLGPTAADDVLRAFARRAGELFGTAPPGLRGPRG